MIGWLTLTLTLDYLSDSYFDRRLDFVHGGRPPQIPAGDAAEGGRVQVYIADFGGDNAGRCTCGLGRQQSEGVLLRAAATTTQSFPGFDQWKKYDNDAEQAGIIPTKAHQ